MSFLGDRVALVGAYVTDLVRRGVPKTVGSIDREVVFVVDGVGGFQAVPILLRRAWRGRNDAPGTVAVRWQFGLPGVIWIDLCWRSRSERKAAEFAEQLVAFRARHPETTIHVVAYSAGTAIAVWACEHLDGRVKIETLVLACSALSPTYNLGPALRSVERCYALVSERDRVILGFGTRVFGTMDRRFVSAAGRMRFSRPRSLSPQDVGAYDRLQEIRWTPDLRVAGNAGGHSGFASVPFLREHMLAILRGEPKLAVHDVATQAID